jgi:SAM-dependent methyltransferase
MPGKNQSTCLGCGSASVEILVDFGAQPPSNRFVQQSGQSHEGHRLLFGQCAVCALCQLVDPMSAGMVKSRFEWLTYNEPEGHLDSLAVRLAGLNGVSNSSVIRGLTYKDESTLKRLQRLGIRHASAYDAARDLGVEDRCAGLETVQELVTMEAAERLTKAHGAADMLLVRHVLEHAHDPSAFLAALGRMVKPGGYLVLEMPDCRKFVEAKDYTFVWEEHITYFSPATARRFAESSGYEVVDLLVYPYPLEDSLVLILRHAASGRVPQRHESLADEARAGEVFGREFITVRQQIHDFVASLKRDGRKIAIFGAGHLAARFINFFDLADSIECVVDDHPRKQGLRMPGSGVPIQGSSILMEAPIDLCLLSLSPESEAKVRESKKDYLAGGGRFASIFVRSPHSLFFELVS